MVRKRKLWPPRGSGASRVAPLRDPAKEPAAKAPEFEPSPGQGGWRSLWRVEAAPVTVEGKRATLYRVVDALGRTFGYHVQPARRLARFRRRGDESSR